MKTTIYTFGFFLMLMTSFLNAQNVTTVTASNSDISDNLDLRAVASIFGDSKNLEDFERRLNDPKNRISNLDLNYDRQVDYLRVIELVENQTHLIILQAVLERDIFQDVATIEIERDRYNNIQIQIVGDVYMYGSNYIYEPVYASRPLIYNVFWGPAYRPYHSIYYWNYYPAYYYAWTPYPAYRYKKHIHVHINHHHHYNYVDTRRSANAVALHNTRRSNGYERSNPNRSFTQRNNVSNRYELENSRNTATFTGRNTNVKNQIPATDTRNSNITSTRNSQTTDRTANITNPVKNTNLNNSRISNSGNTVPSRNITSPATTRNSEQKNISTTSRSTGNTVSRNITSPVIERASSPSRAQNTESRSQSSPGRSSR